MQDREPRLAHGFFQLALDETRIGDPRLAVFELDRKMRDFHLRRVSPADRPALQVTTLLDAVKYPASLIAAMFGGRWSAEVNLRHLKQTLGLDVLRSHSVAGVTKELHAFVIIYNLVRQVRCEAARRQQVAPNRISFVDALRWLRHAQPGATLPVLLVVPDRPGRHQPRVKKRRPKSYPLMTRPRHVLKQLLGIPCTQSLT